MTGWLVVPALLALAVIWADLVRRHLLVVTVHGGSMEPAYSHGDRVLLRRVAPDTLRTGQVVVVHRHRPPGAQAPRWAVIKRIAALPGEPTPLRQDGEAVVPPGKLVLLGDNSGHSTDSRDFGYLDLADVVGVVIRKMRPSP
ncbi:S26 family signal peptidase [Planobispora rosea]|uniref:S26 family signal peptidase n=1 Tax=Planobispora rosea TaxID=35762 RepID=A0A8J3S2U4_PLARO|nr:S26 family signal peptidase [Planobispora rosea]GGS53363.1 S26 family signal peptidase [Planobispora rosea]GIH82603.1 S26 family signal peptidase [Planobispora rosea]